MMRRDGAIWGACVSVTALAITWLEPTVALAAKYMDLHGENTVPSADGTPPKHSLGDFIITVTQKLMTNFLLPVGILMCVWRSAYFAIFCVLAHTDPLHLLNERNLSMVRQTTGTSAKARTQMRRQKALEQSSPAFGDFESVEPEIGIAALKDELRKSARSLFVVMSMWAIFQIIARIVSVFIRVFA